MGTEESGRKEVYELAVKWPGEEWDIETYANEQAVRNRTKHLLSIHPTERPKFYCEHNDKAIVKG